VASLYPKKVNGKTYWYLRQMARVDGKPKMVSERYLGSAEDIEAAMAGSVVVPERTRHLAFGAVAAGWSVLTRLRVIDVVDEVIGPRRVDAGASIGTYLALAALNRLVDPCSRRSLADWWTATAADRFTGIRAGVLDHRRFWDATRAITTAHLAEIERRIVAAMIETFSLDISAVALDMTNFATYIDSGNDKASLAQRGKAKQKRADLRLIGLGLVVTRDGGIPLLSHTYPGNKPDVTQFATMLTELCSRYTAYAATASVSGQVSVVFDAGQNSTTNFADLRATGIGYVTSLPPSDHTDLLALPKRSRRRVDETRFRGLTALQRRKTIYGQPTRVILTHSPTLHAGQSRGLDQTLAKAQARLSDLAQRLARGKTRRDKDTVATEIRTICKDTWVKRILVWELAGTNPAELILTWSIDPDARDRLEEEIFGKRILVTNHDDWPIAEVVAAYRSQSDAEFGFRQLKDPHTVSFSPMNHVTDQAIRVHTYTCVLALQLAHLMRRQTDQAGLHLSVRALVDALAGIGETVLIYPSDGGRPKARRMLTETTTDQNHLIDIFDLHQWTPRT
jgi:transposase